MEEVFVHQTESCKERDDDDKAKIEVSDIRKSTIRQWTCIFIGTILICVFIVLFPFNK